MEYKIRVARESDAAACHDIYGAYVGSTNVTFTIENPSVERYRQKIIDTKKKYPFYVAEDENGRILGYCCGEPLRPHDAYKWNVEWTIVLAPDAPRRAGIATALYRRFSSTLKKQNFQYIYAVIVDTNAPSLGFHKALGFTEAGHFYNVGIKKGTWLGIVWMNKFIGDPSSSPRQVREPVWYEEYAGTAGDQ